MNSSVTSLNASIVFEPLDPGVLKNSSAQMNTLVASIAAGFVRSNYLQAVNDHARALQQAVTSAEKWPLELAILGQVVSQVGNRLQEASRDLSRLPSEIDALREEIQATLQRLITSAKNQSELQQHRLQAIQQPLPNAMVASADLASLMASLKTRRAAAAPKLATAEGELKTIDDALKVISEIKPADIADRSLKSIADTIALKKLKDPAAIVDKAGDLLKRTLQTVEESLTYLSLVESRGHFQKQLSELRADDDRWALELEEMNARLEYLKEAEMLEQQRLIYAEHFNRLPTALRLFVDHLQQTEADLGTRLARIRVVCSTFQAFIATH